MATVQTLELLGEDLRVLSDGASVHVVRGEQGADMSRFRFRMTGDIPSCVSQTTRIYSGEDRGECLEEQTVAAQSTVALRTYEEGAESRSTSDHWLIYDVDLAPGQPIEVVVDIGNSQFTWQLQVEGEYSACRVIGQPNGPCDCLNGGDLCSGACLDDLTCVYGSCRYACESVVDVTTCDPDFTCSIVRDRDQQFVGHYCY